MTTRTKIVSGIAGLGLAVGAAVGLPAVIDNAPVEPTQEEVFLVTFEGEELTREEITAELEVIDEQINILLERERHDEAGILFDRKVMLETLITQ